jgi:hypothetical protein
VTVTSPLPTRPTRPDAPRAPADRPARPAWLVLGAIASVVAIAYGSFSAVALLAWDRHTVHRTFSGPVERVEVDADAGGVRIVTGPADAATVDLRILRGLTEPDHRASLVDGVLRVHDGCPGLLSSFCDVRATITAPAGVSVVVRASGGGVRIRGVEGSVDVDASGGGVEVDGAAGTLRLRSSGGGITGRDLRSGRVDASSSGGGVHLDLASVPTQVTGRSSGGGVSVLVPPGATAYRVDARSSGGGTRNDVHTDPSSDRTIDVDSSGGGVSVGYR